MNLKTTALTLICMLAACSDEPRGLKLGSGLARSLTVAPGGGAVAFLVDAVHPDDRAVPDDLLLGELWMGPIDKPAKHVGAGVPSSPGPGGWAFSADGSELALLANFRFRAGEGELWVGKPGQAPTQVAAAVSEFAWSPKGALAYLARNQLVVRTAGGAKTIVVPLEGVRTFTWSPDGARLAARGSASTGGRLWLVDAESGQKREVASGSSDYSFAPDGTLGVLGPPSAKGGDRSLLLSSPTDLTPARELARATAFAFAPSGPDLALLSTEKQPGEAFGELSRMPRTGGNRQLLGQKTSEFRFTPAGDLLFLSRYDVRARAGTLTYAPAGGAPREIAGKVQSFVVGPQGKRVLYLVQSVQKGDYKIELWTVALGAAGGAGPRKIDEGVYGYQLTPDGATLFWKARCAGGPRSCSLLRAPIDGSQAPIFLVSNVAGFDLSKDGARVLIEEPHRGATNAVDLAVIPALGPAQERVKPFALEVDPSSRFADDQGKRAVFATLRAGSGAVYSAEVP